MQDFRLQLQQEQLWLLLKVILSHPHSQQEDKQSPPNQNQKVNIIQFKLNQKKRKRKMMSDLSHSWLSLSLSHSIIYSPLSWNFIPSCSWNQKSKFPSFWFLGFFYFLILLSVTSHFLTTHFYMYCSFCKNSKSSTKVQNFQQPPKNVPFFSFTHLWLSGSWGMRRHSWFFFSSFNWIKVGRGRRHLYFFLCFFFSFVDQS